MKLEQWTLDRTKIQAHAGSASFRREPRLEERLKRAEGWVEQLAQGRRGAAHETASGAGASGADAGGAGAVAARAPAQAGWRRRASASQHQRAGSAHPEDRPGRLRAQLQRAGVDRCGQQSGGGRRGHASGRRSTPTGAGIAAEFGPARVGDDRKRPGAGMSGRATLAAHFRSGGLPAISRAA